MNKNVVETRERGVRASAQWRRRLAEKLGVGEDITVPFFDGRQPDLEAERPELDPSTRISAPT